MTQNRRKEKTKREFVFLFLEIDKFFTKYYNRLRYERDGRGRAPRRTRPMLYGRGDTDMTLRDATAADVAALAAVEAACFPDDAWSADALRAHFSTPSSPMCLLEDGAAVLGYAAGRCMSPEAEVYRVAVLPAARRRGIGLSLMAALEKRFAEGGCDRFFLEVRASNAAARTLYASLGYAEIGVRRHYYRAPREDAILYQKLLREEA